MSGFDAHRREVLTLISELMDIARNRNSRESVKRLTSAQQQLQKGRFVVVVCGEFKRGKSSLLNALLSEPELFPIDVDIATSVVSTISYGPVEKISVTLTERRREVVRSIDRSDIASYVTERRNPKNAKNVHLLTIQTPNEKLASGLTLVDTPGVGALNSAHTAATYGFLPQADAVVFVGDATSPLTVTELDFVRRIIDSCEMMLFVVTKIDLQSDYERIVANTIEKISEITGRPERELIVLPVSSQAKLDYLKTGDQEDLDLSRFAQFERVLWTELEEQRGRLLGRALSELRRTADALRLPIQTELDALERSNTAELAKLEEELTARREKMARLTDQQAAWRGKLGESLEDVRRGLLRDLEVGLHEIWERLDLQYLEEDYLLDNPQLIVDALNQDVGLLLGRLEKNAARRAAQVQVQAERLTGLTMKRHRVAPLTVHEVDIAISGLPARGGDFAGHALGSTSQAMTGAGPFGSLGGLIGFILGGPAGASIGATIGALIGWTLGYRQAITDIQEQGRAARRNRIDRELGPMRNVHQREAKKGVDETFIQFADAVEHELNARIRLERESLSAALDSIMAARAQTADQSARRVRELKQPVATLDRVQGQIDTIARRLGWKGDDEPAPG